jgi:hypothetical protein
VCLIPRKPSVEGIKAALKERVLAVSAASQRMTSLRVPALETTFVSRYENNPNRARKMMPHMPTGFKSVAKEFKGTHPARSNNRYTNARCGGKTSARCVMAL